MANNTTYSELIAERRIGDHRRKVKYNITTDDRGRRDYFSNLDMDANSKKVQIGKSENESKWNIRNFKGDDETSTTAPFGSHSYQTVMSDFGIDAKEVFKTSTSSKKSPAKKSPAKKSPAKKKPAKKKSSKKKSSKGGAVGGAKKKSSKGGAVGGAKKKSKKKKSKKKKSKKRRR